MLIGGIHIPLMTPFHRDGSLYLRKLEYNVGRYSLTPAAGLVALTGEGAALSDEETLDTLQLIGATAAHDKVLIAAIARSTVRASLRIAESAFAAGFDAVLICASPQRPLLTPAEQRLFFQAIADASPLPVLLFSDTTAALELPVELVASLSRHPNIIGLYDADLSATRYRELADATRDIQHQATVTHIFEPVTRRMVAAASAATIVTASALAGGTAVAVAPSSASLKTRSKAVGFQVMSSGSATGMVELLQAGVAGAMLRLATCAPQGSYEPYAAFRDGDTALAFEKQHRLAEADALVATLGVAAIKYGSDLNGYFGGAPRLPRLGLDAAQKRDVERVFINLKN